MPSDPRSAARRLAARAARTARTARSARGGSTRGDAAVPAGLTVSAKGLELLRTTSLFDVSWIEVQLGRRFEDRDAAVAAYLRHRDCSPHPLFFHEAIDPRFGRPPAKRDPLLWYLNHTRARREASPHPLLDLAVLLERHPELDADHVIPLEGWLAGASDDTPLPTPPGVGERLLGDVRESSLRAARQWRTEHALRHAPRVTSDEPVPYAVPDGPPPTSSDGAPVVSVVMPVWNRATVVRRAVESVQAQSLTDWELLVVDDGSSDDSVAVLTGLAAFDERIRVVTPGRGGVSAARNAGIELARGRYLAFLDTDNRWQPDLLRVLVAELEAHPDWALAHAALRASRDGETYYRAYEGSHEALLVGNHIDLNVLVARTEAVRAVGGFDTGLRRGVDHDLVLNLTREHPPHLVPYIGVDYTDDADDAEEGSGPRISTSESLTWLSVIAGKHLVDWDAARSASRVPGRTSIVLAVPPGPRAVGQWLQGAVRGTGDSAGTGDVEVVVVGTRLPRWQHVVLGVLTELADHARLVTLQLDRGVATAANVGLAAATGERAVVVTGLVDPDPGAALRLADGLGPDHAVAQPVVLRPNGAVDTVGAGFDHDCPRPYPLLADHATADLPGAGGAVAVPAADGPVVALQVAHWAQLGGLDPMADAAVLTDHSLRCRAAGLGEVTLLPDVVVRSRSVRDPEATGLLETMRTLGTRLPHPPGGSAEVWRACGLELLGHRYAAVGAEPSGPADQPVLVPVPMVGPRRPSVAVSEGVPALRWAIDLASPGGERGRGWGDTHYGEALAAALRRRGQHVAVDPREARHRASRDLDDVVLVLRGLDDVVPRPGRVSLQWIISHPDLVTAEEVARYDQVWAASVSWSAEASARWGVAVRPMLQATDPTLFHPRRAEPDSGDDVLFVGNSRGIFRTSVRHAVDAGLDVTVHGNGWDEMLPSGHVASRLVDNADLGALYTSAGLVLNDHWEDMRLTGFVSNRLMDAAASGARVASDPIPGLDLGALLGGLVRTYETADELAVLVRDREALYPSGEERVRAAEGVAARHSFDVRAEELLTEAVRLARRRAEH